MHTGRTGEPILMTHATYYVFSCKQALSGVCIDIAPHFGGQMPPQKNWGCE